MVKRERHFLNFGGSLKSKGLHSSRSFLLSFLMILAVVGPLIVPYEIAEPDYENVLSGPSAEHWAGTDAYGRDIFSRIVAGTQISIFVGLIFRFTRCNRWDGVWVIGGLLWKMGGPDYNAHL